MDLSKLPRLSNTQAPPAPQPPVIEPQAAPTPPSSIPRATGPIAGPELWISLIVGLLLIGISRHFPAYLLDQATGRTYHTGVTFTSDNTEVPYPQVEGFVMLSDAAIFAFGMALLCDALLRTLSLLASVMVARAALVLALCLTLAAVLFNLFVAMKLLQAAIMPLISGLAVAFGGFMAFEQVRAVRSLR